MSRVALILVALAVLVAPAHGASTGFPAHLSGYRVDGTVQSLGPDGVVVSTADGVVAVPLKMATFKVAGKRVEATQLAPGTPVEVDYKGVTGNVLGLQGRRVGFQPKGVATPVTLPLTFVAHSKVYVYTGKGDIVRVPIDQAFAMQGTPNTVVLGSEVPESYRSSYDRDPWVGGSIFWGTGFGPGWGWGPGWYGRRGGWGGWGGGIHIGR